MPLVRKPTTSELEDHFFGSGAFQFGWFDTEQEHFPAIVSERNPDTGKYEGEIYIFTEDLFIEGIKKYAESLEDRTFDDLIEDMDAVDVDNVIQLIMFGEIRYS